MPIAGIGTVPATGRSRGAAEIEAQMRFDDDGGAAPLVTADAAPIPERMCGRCRKLFDGDRALHPTAQQEWWLCATCRTALLGDRHAVKPRTGDIAPPVAR
jgi:hypothetical protein